jgi:hypothetical protein
MFMSKEVEMTELGKGQKEDQQPKKYLWFGYGNYGGGNVTRQLGGGNVRDPSLFEELFKNSKTCFLYAAALLVGVMVLVMLLAWGLSLAVR